jgi:hypothetical protein
MSRATLQDVADLTLAARTAKEAQMRDIAAQEARIRRDLATLAQHRAEAMAHVQSEGFALRRAGADVLWQGWLDGTERALQVELAQVLARKEEMRRQLQRAHGRSAAAADLLANARRERRDASETRRARQEHGMMLLSAATRRARP